MAVVSVSTESRHAARSKAITGNQLDGDRLLTLEEVCEFLQLPVATARKQRVEGKFVPAYKVGKYLRFRRSAVLEWLEAHADEV
jgi:excisionase family DNA binding protein